MAIHNPLLWFILICWYKLLIVVVQLLAHFDSLSKQGLHNCFELNSLDKKLVCLLSWSRLY